MAHSIMLLEGETIKTLFSNRKRIKTNTERGFSGTSSNMVVAYMLM